MLKKKLLPLLYPRRCPVCRAVLPYGRLICTGCARALPFVLDPTCLKCGKPISRAEDMLCRDCRRFPKSFRSGRALFVYNDKIKPAVMDFKYHNRRMLADFFIHEAVRRHGDDLRRWQINAVVPVPIHRSKRKKRGYNQAALLARELAQVLSLPCYPELLLRRMDTPPLKRFSPQARLNHLRGAFSLNPRYRKTASRLSRVLLIDDIYTTGATMELCTRVLLQAGVEDVYVYSLCIGDARD